ncbi:MAG TPA: response regulator [Acidobacteria bacterium]|nr:response regulator [Acidobacteriota bacterium]
MDPAPRIAVVEDETDIAEILQYNLQREGFRPEVYHRGDTALAAIEADPPQLVILDLMLPGIDGLEICRHLKRNPRTASIPLVMLTARGEETDRIVGLELGADDYVAKPFNTRELLLRVKAVLRRAGAGRTPSEGPLVAGSLRLFPDAHRVEVEQNEVTLTATEFRLLAHLMQRAGRVQGRETLLREVWGYSSGVDSRTVDTHVRRLRKKLGPESERIETVIGVGYRFHR